MIKIAFCIVFMTFIQSVFASQELTFAFNETRLDLIKFFEGSPNSYLRTFGDRVRKKEIVLKIIDPKDLNISSRRHSAFYSEGKVFISRSLDRKLEGEGLRPLLIHEILSANNVGDADYELSQMINWYMSNSLNVESEHLSDIIKKRINHSIAFSNEPQVNRSLRLSNGGSIVGGGGDYLEAHVLSSFLEKAMDRRLKILGMKYVNLNKGILTSLMSDLSNMVIFRKNNCYDTMSAIYIGKKGLHAHLPTIVVLYNGEEDDRNLVEALDFIDHSNMTIDNPVFPKYISKIKVFRSRIDLSLNLSNESCEL
jgi:hypothetical protein